MFFHHYFRQDGIAPNFTQKPVIQQVDGGKKLLVECQLTADPEPSITWFRDGTQITAGGKIQMRAELKSPKNYLIVLEITDVSPQDAGSYKVTAKNALGESNATIGLNFDAGDANKPKGSKPLFTQKPVIRQVEDKIIFECILTADPVPTITWMQGNKVITGGPKYKMTDVADKTSHTITLEISNVGASDGGEYKAIAKNSLGESTATITLNLEGKKPK
ncbi:hypothetical protein ACJMK2_020493 [Sinanodonta woodiana]|uniref:Ig-like domain-containing protein n=1 Tax=Sinanodonta woodiana TaxID=1069815 RepID=A0ABD3U097_SINWO